MDATMRADTMRRINEVLQVWAVVRPAAAEMWQDTELDPDKAFAWLARIAAVDPELPVTHELVTAIDRLTVMFGVSHRDIAAMTGQRAELIDKWHTRPLRSAKSREVMLMHAEGYTPVEIAAALNVRRNNVYRWLEEAEVTPNRRRRAYPPKARQKAALLYKAGRTYSEIGKALDVPSTHVATILRSAHRAGELPEYGERFQQEVYQKKG